MFWKKFGLKEALKVVGEKPDISKNEAKVGTAFVGALGIKVTVVKEVEAKIASLKNLLAETKQAITDAIKGIVDAKSGKDSAFAELAAKVQALVEAVKSIAAAKVGEVSAKTGRKVARLQAKIYTAKGVSDLKIGDINEKAVKEAEALQKKLEKEIAELEENASKTLENLQSTITELKAEVAETTAEIGDMEKIKAIFG